MCAQYIRIMCHGAENCMYDASHQVTVTGLKVCACAEVSVNLSQTIRARSSDDCVHAQKMATGFIVDMASVQILVSMDSYKTRQYVSYTSSEDQVPEVRA